MMPVSRNAQTLHEIEEMLCLVVERLTQPNRHKKLRSNTRQHTRQKYKA